MLDSSAIYWEFPVFVTKVEIVAAMPTTYPLEGEITFHHLVAELPIS